MRVLARPQGSEVVFELLGDRWGLVITRKVQKRMCSLLANRL